MDIEHMKSRKAEVENKIRDLIVGFIEDTGLDVEGINYARVDTSTIAGKREMHCILVKLQLTLD